MGFSKNRAKKTPKWDGENNGLNRKPYESMDDLGGCFPLFSETAICHMDPP